MSDSLINQLKNRLEADVKACQTHISGGGAKDFAAYKEVVGKVSGLNMAIDYVNELIKRVEGDEDDNDE